MTWHFCWDIGQMIPWGLTNPNVRKEILSFGVKEGDCKYIQNIME